MASTALYEIWHNFVAQQGGKYFRSFLHNRHNLKYWVLRNDQEYKYKYKHTL